MILLHLITKVIKVGGVKSTILFSQDTLPFLFGLVKLHTVATKEILAKVGYSRDENLIWSNMRKKVFKCTSN